MQRRLGAGAYGVVYAAYDRETATVLALKHLRAPEADALYRFKKGFRSLADIRHPNLVAFYELLAEDDQWFLTQELVDGTEFVQALRPDLAPDPLPSSWSREADRPMDPRRIVPPGPPSVPIDFDRVRDVTAQLARAIHTLHRHGKMHRDIKPPNVLVTRQGRVVVLDFGLVAELGPLGTDDSATAQMAGTPAYMPPEQIEGEVAHPSGDWYGIGVMLYEALVGALPFTGSLVEMMVAKQRGLPVPMRELVPGLPADLASVVEGLLLPDGSARLTGDEVLRRLAVASAGVPTSFSAGVTLPLLPRRDAVFVGRGESLASLRQAHEASRQHAVAMLVHGGSGMGKTALTEHFLDTLEKGDHDAVILRGRCYRQETVPYKVFDSVIDALSRYLYKLPMHEAEVLLPARVASLARLFPVLSRVRAVARASSGAIDPVDPQVRRRRAFEALRELLARLAERVPVVLFVDDLHWGDVDSLTLLETLLRPPDAPSLLWVGAYRSELAATSPFLQALADRESDLTTSGLDLRRIDIGELPSADATALATALLEEASSPERVASMVDEAGGSPFLLAELARSWRAGVRGLTPGDGADLTLADVFLERVASLGEEARLLLEVVSVAGRPIDLDVARQAAAIGGSIDDALATVRGARLLRRQTADGRQEIDTYHDRIREVVTAGLDADVLRAHHLALALALEASGRADPETLAAHFQMTEERERAGGYAASAAALAETALAFHRAARLYRLALELLPTGSDDRFALVVKLASALANAGHGLEAADTYLEAVGDAGYLNPVELQRQAAEKLLVSGHIDRGLSVLRHVLRSVELPFHRPAWRRLLSLWANRVALRLRGFDFTEQSLDDLDDASLRRIDVCWSVVLGLCMVDVLRAAEFHARHLLLALRAGEPRRIARGLAMELFFGSMDGVDTSSIHGRVRKLADANGDRYTLGLIEMASGLRSLGEGAWPVAEAHFEIAESELHEAGIGVAWELDTVAQARVLCQLHRGHWPSLFVSLPAQLEQARTRGDRYLEVHLRLWAVPWRRLAEDEPDAARREVEEAMAQWTHDGFHVQHVGHLLAAAHVALYGGDGWAAWPLIEDAWRGLTRAMVQRVPFVAVLTRDLRARCAVSAAAQSQRLGAGAPEIRRRQQSVAAAEARWLAATGHDWGRASSAMIEAGVASLRGRLEEAESAFLVAEERFRHGDMLLHAMVARRQRGVITAGTSGATLQAEADAWLTEQGIRRPEGLAAVLAPGRWR